MVIVERILKEYPGKTMGGSDVFYRIRKNPSEPADPLQYDSPPEIFCGKGRLDTRSRPALYASPDVELCVHECRVAAEDDLNPFQILLFLGGLLLKERF